MDEYQLTLSDDVLADLRELVESIPGTVEDLLERFDATDPESAEQTLLALGRARQVGALILITRLNELSSELRAGLQALLNQPAPMYEYEKNRREIAAWRRLHSVGINGDIHDLTVAADAILTAREGASTIFPRIDLEQHHRRYMSGTKQARVANSVG